MHKAVGLIFSKDRAMQLDAVLKSLSFSCRDLNQLRCKVLWMCSDQHHEQQYHEIAAVYPEVEFLRQQDFKTQVLLSIRDYKYVLFLVDDNIFVRDFSLLDIIGSLEKSQDALGFSLRLGINTNYCYPLKCKQEIPAFIDIPHGFLKYDWTQAEYDFGYPLEVSSSLYRTSDIKTVLERDFFNPNTLEIQLNNQKNNFFQHRKFLLCNKYSYTFCNPVNKVQTLIDNRAGENIYYDSAKLSAMFSEGYRIDVKKFQGFTPNACHQEKELSFIPAPTGAVPLVSVVMPVYNAAEYLQPAIESILNQTFRDFEFIIIEDGSDDDSLNIIRRYQDPRIVLIQNGINLRLVASLNKGLQAARGKYIARMDADDISMPDRLARQVEFMEQHPDIGVCGTWVELFGACQGRGSYTNDPDTAKCLLLFGCPVAHPSTMIRKAVLADGLTYSLEYPHAEDYALWVRIAQLSKISNVTEVLLKYRISPSQVSTKYAQQQIETTIKIQMEQLYALGIRPSGQELSLHWLLSKKQFVPVNFVQPAAEWLRKLKEANDILHCYPETQFTEVLRIYWKSVCQNLLKAF